MGCGASTQDDVSTRVPRQQSFFARQEKVQSFFAATVTSREREDDDELKKQKQKDDEAKYREAPGTGKATWVPAKRNKAPSNDLPRPTRLNTTNDDEANIQDAISEGPDELERVLKELSRERVAACNVPPKCWWWNNGEEEEEEWPGPPLSLVAAELTSQPMVKVLKMAEMLLEAGANRGVMAGGALVAALEYGSALADIEEDKDQDPYQLFKFYWEEGGLDPNVPNDECGRTLLMGALGFPAAGIHATILPAIWGELDLAKQSVVALCPALAAHTLEDGSDAKFEEVWKEAGSPNFPAIEGVPDMKNPWESMQCPMARAVELATLHNFTSEKVDKMAAWGDTFDYVIGKGLKSHGGSTACSLSSNLCYGPLDALLKAGFVDVNSKWLATSNDRDSGARQAPAKILCAEKYLGVLKKHDCTNEETLQRIGDITSSTIRSKRSRTREWGEAGTGGTLVSTEYNENGDSCNMRSVVFAVKAKSDALLKVEDTQFKCVYELALGEAGNKNSCVLRQKPGSDEKKVTEVLSDDGILPNGEADWNIFWFTVKFPSKTVSRFRFGKGDKVGEQELLRHRWDFSARRQDAEGDDEEGEVDNDDDGDDDADDENVEMDDDTYTPFRELYCMTLKGDGVWRLVSADFDCVKARKEKEE